MHRANEIRPVLSRLAALAEHYYCAVILIGHQNKAFGGGKNIYRGLGSIDIAAAARSVLTVTEMPGEKNRRAMVQIKSSLAPAGKPVLFDLDPEKGFAWAGTSDMSAEEILGEDSKIKMPTLRENAEEFLKDILKNGKMKSKDIEEQAEECNINIRTLRVAREKMGIICKRGIGKDSSWYWELVKPNPDVNNSNNDNNDNINKII